MSLKIVEGKRGEWMKMLERNERGGYKPSYLNACTAMSEAPEWQGVLGYDEFALRTMARREPVWGAGHGAVWSDHHDLLALKWLQEKGIHVSIQVCAAAIQEIAIEHRFHPVREWLEGLKWDGTERIETWLSQYLGVNGGAAEENQDADRVRDLAQYCGAIGPRWLISAVARIYKPGCKADCVLVLEGAQGVKKSSALKALTDPWFTDDLATVGSKDAAEQLRGAWLIELSELNALSKAELSAAKSFISRSMDRYRPSYGRRVIEAQRQCVFAGTVNPSEYLRDETGARRFWPVAVGSIDLDQLRRDREQLWGEAVHQYKAGVSWWLNDPGLEELARAQQGDRYESDPWEALLLAEDGLPKLSWQASDGSVSIADILKSVIQKDTGNWSQSDRLRVAKILKRNGWERYNRRSTGGSDWRYRKPKTRSFQSTSSLTSSCTSSLSPIES